MQSLRLLTAVGLLICVNSSFGQSCPAGFTDVGSLHKADSATLIKEAKVHGGTTDSLRLPKNLVVDTSYQQPPVKGSGGDAQGSAVQAPPGFHLIATGSESANCQGWAVSNPVQFIVERNGNTIIQEGLQMNMYCHSGSSAACMSTQRGCNATVKVCVKTK